jgi:hypothetical protein
VGPKPIAVTVSLCLMLGTQAACNPFRAPNAARIEPIALNLAKSDRQAEVEIVEGAIVSRC